MTLPDAITILKRLHASLRSTFTGYVLTIPQGGLRPITIRDRSLVVIMARAAMLDP